MADLWTYATLASGVVIAALGMALLAADPRRDWNRVFAVFALFWGLQIVTANAVRLIDVEAFARPLALLSLAFLIPLYFFIVVFASIYPRPCRPFGRSFVWMLVLLVPAAVDLVLLVAAPRMLLAEVVALPAGGSTMRWGPLFAPLVLAPLYGGFFYALFVMMRRLHEAEHRIERRQVLLVLTALGIFVAYNVPLQSLLFGAAAVGGAARSEAEWSVAVLIGAVMSVGLVLLVVLVSGLARSWGRAASRTQAREMRGILFALMAAAAVGTLEAAIALGGGPRLAAAGPLRIVSVALIGYGVARYQLFDLDLRIKDATRFLSMLLLFAVGVATAWALLRAFAVLEGLNDWFAAGTALLVAIPMMFLLRRLADRILPTRTRHGERLYLRKLEVYQVALVETHGAGADDARLVRLRGRLGLGPEDHAIAARLVANRQGEPAHLAPGLVVFDRYFLDAVLGEGTYGRIFLARDLVSGRRVAIKELEARWRGHPAVFTRFLREARVMGRLDHPRIVRLHEVERRGADQYLVMEHVEGGTLAERLQAGRLSRLDALRIAGEILEGLEVAHARGVVHRDLKPANILVDLDGHVKIADFGVASVEATPADATLEALPDPDADQVVGNLAYMAPEQVEGRSVEARADLYAVGAIVYHMLTGRPHRDLEGLDRDTARERVAKDKVPDLSHVDRAVARLLERMLVPDVAKRDVDAATLRRELGVVAPLEGVPTQGPLSKRPSPASGVP